MDLITAAAVAYVSKDGIEKLLGPTFEYYGQGLKNLTESFNIKAKENLKKIFGRAIVKKGHELEKNGIINPRINAQNVGSTKMGIYRLIAFSI